MIQAHLKEGMGAGVPETLGFNLIAAGKEGEKKEEPDGKESQAHSHRWC